MCSRRFLPILQTGMQVTPATSSSPLFPASFSLPAAAARGLLDRLVLAVQGPDANKAAPILAGTLTPELIKSALLELGAAAGEADVALAFALTQAGLPLTLGALAEANGVLAGVPEVSPPAYVLAKSLGLPTSPDALRALSAVLAAPEGEGTAQLPERVTAWLGLALEAGTSPPALARGLREMLLQVGRSTEHRLLNTHESRMPVVDMRTSLLRLAEASGDRSLQNGANGLASLLEGQQLLNQASLTAHAGQSAVPLYFALPLMFDGQPGMAEAKLWLHEKDCDSAEESEVLRATLRLAPPKLGRVQADLAGLLSGVLSCRFGAEKPSSVRLLMKHAGSLAEALSAAGWETNDVTCRVQTDWPPLYHGGMAFSTPRTCVDWHI